MRGRSLAQEAVPVLRGGYEGIIVGAAASGGAPVARRGGRGLFYGKGEGMKRRALVSVSDKQGIVEFARRLSEMGFEIISTGGTARALDEAGVAVILVSEVTGEPELLGRQGQDAAPQDPRRHPRQPGGPGPRNPARRARHRPDRPRVYQPIPFRADHRRWRRSENEAIEQIDIGGPAMLRAAAKNYKSVTVVSSPDHSTTRCWRSWIQRDTSPKRHGVELALAAFSRTAEYDAAISTWMAGESAATEEDTLPEKLDMSYQRVLSLRYGENPHQKGAYYARIGEQHLLSGVERIQGKDLSFNNLYDVDAARTLLAELGDGPAAVIIKHANPCGVAVADEVGEAYEKALASDPLSAFGGIVALNRPVDGDLAAEISKVFTEVLISPEFTPEAREKFSEKPDLRLLAAGNLDLPPLSAKDVTGGILLQQTDTIEGASDYQAATEKRPDEDQMQDLLFAWRVAKRVRSNAIVLARVGATVGIGGGLTSRVDAAELAVKKAADRAEGAVAASDAFFPFADGIEALAKAGIAAIIQPGGSRRDEEVVDAANKHGIAMIFTGRRHFLH